MQVRGAADILVIVSVEVMMEWLHRGGARCDGAGLSHRHEDEGHRDQHDRGGGHGGAHGLADAAEDLPGQGALLRTAHEEDDEELVETDHEGKDRPEALEG
jgi:hypothetical protein